MAQVTVSRKSAIMAAETFMSTHLFHTARNVLFEYVRHTTKDSPLTARAEKYR